MSDNCELLTVHRQCPTIGIRSDLVSEVTYVDFMIDVVDPGRIAGDHWAAAAFQGSLTPEDRNRAIEKMGRPAAAEPAPAKVVPMRPSARFDPDRSGNYQDALAALTDLGYKRAQAKRALDYLGPRVDQLPLEEAIKAALQGCLAV